MDHSRAVKKYVSESMDLKRAILDDEELVQRTGDAVDALVKSFKNGGQAFFCGNGGSAADAQHLAAELSGRLNFDRAPLPAEAFTVNTSFLTAVGNDYSFDDIYKRSVEGFCKKGDVLFGISTSGNSENVLRAQIAAKKKGVTVISLTGKDGGKIKRYCDILLNIPSSNTQHVQEGQVVLGHIICELVEATLFAKKEKKAKRSR